MKWKVYKIHGCDWVVAESKKQAIECWKSTTGDFLGVTDKEIEIETKPLNELTFWYDEYGERTTTFDKRIKDVLASGEEKIPFFLASTEF